MLVNVYYNFKRTFLTPQMKYKIPAKEACRQPIFSTPCLLPQSYLRPHTLVAHQECKCNWVSKIKFCLSGDTTSIIFQVLVPLKRLNKNL